MNVDWSLRDNGNAFSQCTFFKKWLAQCTTIGMDRILTLPRDTPVSLPPYSQWKDHILQKWVRRLTQHFWISSSLGLPAIQRNAIDPDLVYATSSCNVELQSKPVTSKLTSAGSHYVVHSILGRSVWLLFWQEVSHVFSHEHYGNQNKVMSLSCSQYWCARSPAGDGEPSHLEAAHFNDVGNS